MPEKGQRERGLEWARRALALDPEDSGMLYNTAGFVTVRGEPEEPLECLEKAVRAGTLAFPPCPASSRTAALV